MRPKERIPIFLERINLRRLFKNWGLSRDYAENIEEHKDSIKEFWLNHPDLVFMQVLQEFMLSSYWLLAQHMVQQPILFLQLDQSLLLKSSFMKEQRQ